MPESPDELTEIATRHQVYLEGLKTHETKKAQKFLKDIDRVLAARLATKDLTTFSRNNVLKSV